VAEGYGISDWATSLYNNVVIRGDVKYLNEYKKTFPLPASIFTEVIKKYVTYGIISLYNGLMIRSINDKNWFWLRYAVEGRFLTRSPHHDFMGGDPNMVYHRGS